MPGICPQKLEFQRWGCGIPELFFHFPSLGCGIPELFLGVAMGAAAGARVAGEGPCPVSCQPEFLFPNPNHHACRKVLGPRGGDGETRLGDREGWRQGAWFGGGCPSGNIEATTRRHSTAGARTPRLLNEEPRKCFRRRLEALRRTHVRCYGGRNFGCRETARALFPRIPCVPWSVISGSGMRVSSRERGRRRPRCSDGRMPSLLGCR